MGNLEASSHKSVLSKGCYPKKIPIKSIQFFFFFLRKTKTQKSTNMYWLSWQSWGWCRNLPFRLGIFNDCAYVYLPKVTYFLSHPSILRYSPPSSRISVATYSKITKLPSHIWWQFFFDPLSFPFFLLLLDEFVMYFTKLFFTFQ